MARRRWVQIDGKLVEVTQDYEAIKPASAAIFGDIPAYESPVTGECIDSRAKRREDLARTASRPYEGREQEQREADRQRAYAEQQSDARLHEAASRAFYGLSDKQQRTLIYGR